MRLLQELLTTDVGLFSAIGIAFMIGMGGFFMWLFTRGPASGSARPEPPADDE